MNMNRTANRNRNTRSGLSYVYVSYVSNNNGYVAVIDPTTDEIKKRISTGRSPAAMCLSPSGDKLFVADDLGNVVFVYSTDDFRYLGGIPVGNKPAAILIEPSGKFGFVANYGEASVTFFDPITLKVLGSFNLKKYGTPFAIACNENNPFVSVAGKGFSPIPDFVVYFNMIENGYGNSSTHAKERVYDPTHNPLTVRPNGQTLVELANIGFVDFINGLNSSFNTTSLLDNTVSGIYLDNGLLFCTMREEREILKVFKNLNTDANGNITYDYFKEIPSYKGQDKIRASLTQKYIGVTVQAYDSPLGGLQIIDVDHLSSRFLTLASTGDLAFFSDTKAYVGGFNSVQPIDLINARPLEEISIGTVYFRVKNVICGYSNQT
ncbi:YncE family protein [Paenibacillus sp. FSL R7-0333]|uniref:YncE family protein n=1 Tax=Paenibacillus sp. FSL R7-0333 TaxID=1926587 RepID=UPI00096E207C|nr:hypothetical protein BK146_31710 [Paenibacillus sp. FSL R7-0333]